MPYGFAKNFFKKIAYNLFNFFFSTNHPSLSYNVLHLFIALGLPITMACISVTTKKSADAVNKVGFPVMMFWSGVGIGITALIGKYHTGFWDHFQSFYVFLAIF